MEKNNQDFQDLLAPIRHLSDSTLRKIAVGEVIDRPIKVVKELIENSLDAGATRIEVRLEDSGRSLIEVTDNGSGLAPDELPLAFSRHATSRLKEEDLSKIEFLGFRGEALAAIATAAKVSLISRRGQEEARKILLESGDPKVFNLLPAAFREGTRVEVRDLFCFMPNKLRFLPSKARDYMAIQRLMRAMALAHPDKAFSLKNNGNVSPALFPSDFHMRALQVCGTCFFENSFFFEAEKEGVRFWGYLSIPSYNRSPSPYNFTYVRTRLVEDRRIKDWIRSAYFNSLPEGFNPAVILFLDLPPEGVDVNRHPNKLEVRFEDETFIKNFIIEKIRDRIRGVKVADRTDALPGQLSFDWFEGPEGLLEKKTKEDVTLQPGILGRPQFQLNNKFIIAINDKGLVIVDQHAAHERLLLEQIKSCNVIKKQLTLPLAFKLTRPELDLLDSLADNLKEWGLDLKVDGEELFIFAVPSFPGNLELESLITAILEDPSAFQERLDYKKDRILAKVACYYSIRAGRSLKLQEMEELLRAIEKSEGGSSCPHGRPSYFELSYNKLDSLFER